MYPNKKVFIYVIIGLLVTTSSCKKYLDVNKDPNVSQTATVQTLLPSCQVYIASAMGVDMEINGSIWAQFWTQSPNASQYRPLEQYNVNAQNYETPWTNLYAGGENLVQLDKLALAQNKKQYRAISFLLKAYMFQVITDAWGDIPFSQALLGDSGVTSPKYDAQQAIYTGLLGMIDSANALIDPSDPVLPGSDDLIYGGKMGQWTKFSNTLRLKILLRLSQKDPGTAQAGIAALFASNPTFLGSGDDAQVNFSSTSGNKNPLYSEQAGLGFVQNLVASATCLDSMLSNNDPRISVFYEPDANGAFTGILQGNYSTSVSTESIPSFNVAGDAQNSQSALAPVKFLTGYESCFLQAEVFARGWATGSDTSLFYQGIAANFNSYSNNFPDTVNATTALANYEASAYWASYPSGGSATQKIRAIITQKWFSMCGNQGFEAWTEWRRTGYPDFFTISKSSLIGNNFPRRFLYPYSEVTRNLNFPGIKGVTVPVWWDNH